MTPRYSWWRTCYIMHDIQLRYVSHEDMAIHSREKEIHMYIYVCAHTHRDPRKNLQFECNLLSGIKKPISIVMILLLINHPPVNCDSTRGSSNLLRRWWRAPSPGLLLHWLPVDLQLSESFLVRANILLHTCQCFRIRLGKSLIHWVGEAGGVESSLQDKHGYGLVNMIDF